ncbi:MAG TPA: hypothetical protein VN915_17005 [Elusimicrobiota bacterium]|nr:hypothetical protein [Elusimicrobiota bacterium]
MPRNTALALIALVLAIPAAAQQAASTPVRDALQAGAANPACAMSAVTGDACASGDVSAVASSTAAAKTDPSAPAIAHRAETVVPDPAAKKKKGSFMGKAEKGIGDYFSDDMVKEGTAFGAAAGMLLLAWSPVGIIGGALIGAAVGAIICGGLISKLWHHFHKS